MYINKIILVLLLGLTVMFAHGKHKKTAQKLDTVTVVGKDTIAINGIAVNKALVHNQTTSESALTEKEEIEEGKEVTFGAVFEHMHNKLIHFPIALTIVALLLMAIGYKDNKYLAAVKIIVPFAAFVTIFTVLAGLSQAAPFEGTAMYGLVETHEILGLGVLLSLILWSVSLYVKKLNKFIYLFAVLNFILVSITGFYGGIIAH